MLNLLNPMVRVLNHQVSLSMSILKTSSGSCKKVVNNLESSNQFFMHNLSKSCKRHIPKMKKDKIKATASRNDHRLLELLDVSTQFFSEIRN
jgi:hypothetical protein